jgi:uncharacterized repeat protein (TIGR01451 family)
MVSCKSLRLRLRQLWLTIVFIGSGAVQAQQAITNATVNLRTGPARSYNSFCDTGGEGLACAGTLPLSTITLTFAGEIVEVDTISAGPSVFVKVDPPNGIALRRAGTAVAQGPASALNTSGTDRELLFFTRAVGPGGYAGGSNYSASGTVPANATVYLTSPYYDSTEAAFLAGTANVGVDNLFSNVCSGGWGCNNVERLDVFTTAFVPRAGNLGNRGFIVVERGSGTTGDRYKIRGIKGNAATGVCPGPASTLNAANFTDSRNGGTNWGLLTTPIYGTGNPNLIITTRTPSSPAAATANGTATLLDDHSYQRPNQSLAPQGIRGEFWTYASLGFAAGDLVCGYALFGNDSSGWDYTNSAENPLTTDGGNNGGTDVVTIGGTYVTRSTIGIRKVTEVSTGTFSVSGTNGITGGSGATVSTGVPVTVGSTTYTVASQAAQTVLTETVPAGWTAVSGSCVDEVGSPLTSPAVTFAFDATASPNTTRTATLTVPAAYSAGENLICTFVNRSVQTGLTITKTNSTTTVASGSVTIYQIDVSNSGPAAANGAILKDPALSGLSCTSVTCATLSGGAVCPAPGAGAGQLSIANLQAPAGVVVPNMPSSSSLRLTLTCSVSATGQ